MNQEKLSELNCSVLQSPVDKEAICLVQINVHVTIDGHEDDRRVGSDCCATQCPLLTRSPGPSGSVDASLIRSP